MKIGHALRILVFILLTVGCIQTLYAQGNELHFRHWQTSDGLSNSTVSCFLYDKQGYLWIGTENGLNRYDGKRFKVYESPAFNYNYIESLQEDARGDIWFDNYGTYARYDHAKDAVDSNVRLYLLRQLDIKAGSEHKIFVDKEGNLWVISRDGLNRHSFLTNQTDKKQNTGLEKLTFTDMHLADAGDYIIVVQQKPLKLSKIDKATMEHTSIDVDATMRDAIGNNSCNIYANQLGALWLFSYYGDALFRKTPGENKWEKIKTPSSSLNGEKAVFSVRGITSTPNGRIYIATDKRGIFRYNTTTGEFSNLAKTNQNRNSLLSNNINAVYCDGNGNVWVGYYKMGMSVSSKNINKRFQTTYQQFGDVIALHGDSHGGVWIGTAENGVWHVDENGQRNYLQGQTVTEICEDRQGRLWVGTFHNGIFGFDGKEWHNYNKTNCDLPDNAVIALQFDRMNNLWVGMPSGHLTKMAVGSDGSLKRCPERYDVYGQCFAYDGKDDLYVGTYYGVAHINVASGDINVFIGNKSGTQRFDNMSVSSLMLEKQAGRLWVGHSPSLDLLDLHTDSLYTISTIDGLCDNMVNDITLMSPNNVMVQTSRGLSYINVTNDDIGRLHFNIESFTNSLGIDCTHFNKNATARIDNDKLLLGTPDGCLEVDCNMFPAINYNGAQSVRFTGLMIEGHNIQPDSLFNGRVIIEHPMDMIDVLKLRHDYHQITFLFSPVELVQATDMRFAYKIDGLQDEWMYTNESQITLSTLAPGEYTLRVRLGNDYEGMATLNIIVSRPFYRTALAYLTYIVLLILIIWFITLLIIRKQRNNLTEHRKTLERQHKEQLSETMLNFYSNVSEDLRTPITHILAQLTPLKENEINERTKRNLTDIEEHAKHLLNIVETLLDFRRIESGVETLEITSGKIGDIVKEVCASFNDEVKAKEIELHVRTKSNETVTTDFGKVKKIINNLLSNALKATPNKGKIDVKSEYKDGDLWQITIADTGKGISDEDKKRLFKRFFKSNNDEPGNGIGLCIVGEYVRLLGGVTLVQDNKPAGTVFTVTLPTQSKEHKGKTNIKEPTTALQPTPIRTETKPTILLVGEDNDLIDLISGCLRSDYDVVTTPNGREALDIVLTEKVNVVVSDTNIAVMNGKELCQNIKNNNTTANIPVIMLINKNEESNTSIIGANDYITKPFDIDILKMSISKLLKTKIN